MKIGVIAGTPIDTQMGAAFFSGRGFDVFSVPVSETPEEQSALQILMPDKLEAIVSQKLARLKQSGISHIVVYCNSLSSAVDFGRLQSVHGISIVTPHDVYRKMANTYNILGVLAANNQSAAGIEKTIQQANPACHVIGVGILPLVVAIEQRMAPEEIIARFEISKILSFFSAIGCGALILGCTHFPYLYDQICTMTRMKVIDPATGMEEILLKYRGNLKL